MENTENVYYVYGLIDPRNKEIFYIGKGKGKRAYQHLTEEYTEEKGNREKINRIKEIQKKQGKQPEIKFFAENLSEEAAYALEEILIDRIGRKILGYGPLTNWIVGGAKEDQYKFGLEEHEKTTIDIVKVKFPEILPVIESIPRTTKEDNIKEKWSKIVQNVLTIINSFDDKILEEIEASDIRFLDHYKGEAIQFECKHGSGEISFSSDEQFKMLGMGTSSVYLRKNGKIILGLPRLFQNEVTTKLREYNENEINKCQ
jgi:hypothetical protein